MNLFTPNSPYYHFLKYLLFLLKHPVYSELLSYPVGSKSPSTSNDVTLAWIRKQQIVFPRNIATYMSGSMVWYPRKLNFTVTPSQSLAPVVKTEPHPYKDFSCRTRPVTKPLNCPCPFRSTTSHSTQSPPCFAPAVKSPVIQ